MKRIAPLAATILLLFVLGCSGGGTIPAGAPAEDLSDGSDETGSAISFDCETLQADIRAACGDDAADLGSDLEGTLPHIVCSRMFSTGDPNRDPAITVFLRTHQSVAARDIAWRPREGSWGISIGDGGYAYAEDLAYSHIDHFIAHKGLVTLQLKSVEWTRGTKPPAICTPEELEMLASSILARV